MDDSADRRRAIAAGLDLIAGGTLGTVSFVGVQPSDELRILALEIADELDLPLDAEWGSLDQSGDALNVWLRGTEPTPGYAVRLGEPI